MELGPTVIKSKEKKIEDEILKRWMKTLKKKSCITSRKEKPLVLLVYY